MKAAGHGAHERLEGNVLVQQQRQPQAEGELDRARDHRVEEVFQTDRRNTLSVTVLVVLDADPLARPATFASVKPSHTPSPADRSGNSTSNTPRQHEQQPEEVAVVEQPAQGDWATVGSGAAGACIDRVRGQRSGSELKICAIGSSAWRDARPASPLPRMDVEPVAA